SSSTRNRPEESSTVALLFDPPLSSPTTTHASRMTASKLPPRRRDHPPRLPDIPQRHQLSRLYHMQRTDDTGSLIATPMFHPKSGLNTRSTLSQGRSDLCNLRR